MKKYVLVVLVTIVALTSNVLAGPFGPTDPAGPPMGAPAWLRYMEPRPIVVRGLGEQKTKGEASDPLAMFQPTDHGKSVHKSNELDYCAMPLDFNIIYHNTLEPLDLLDRPLAYDIQTCNSYEECEATEKMSMWLKGEFEMIVGASGNAGFDWDIESEVWGKDNRTVGTVTTVDEDYERKEDAVHTVSGALVERRPGIDDFDDAEIEDRPDISDIDSKRYRVIRVHFNNYSRLPVTGLSSSEDPWEFVKVTLKDRCTDPSTGEQRKIEKIFPFSIKYNPLDREYFGDIKVKMKFNEIEHINDDNSELYVYFLGAGEDAEEELSNYHNSTEPNNYPDYETAYSARLEKWDLSLCEDNINHAECNGSRWKHLRGMSDLVYLTDMRKIAMYAYDPDDCDSCEMLEVTTEYIKMCSDNYCTTANSDMRADTISTGLAWLPTVGAVLSDLDLDLGAVIDMSSAYWSDDCYDANEYIWPSTWLRKEHPEE